MKKLINDVYSLLNKYSSYKLLDEPHTSKLLDDIKDGETYTGANIERELDELTSQVEKLKLLLDKKAADEEVEQTLASISVETMNLQTAFGEITDEIRALLRYLDKK